MSDVPLASARQPHGVVQPVSKFIYSAYQDLLAVGHGRNEPAVTALISAFHPNKDCPMQTLAELFEHTLKDVYYAENAIAKAMPKVAKVVKNADLKKAVEHHLEETKSQIKTLDKVFKTIGVKPEGVKCDATDGLIKEAEGLIEEGKGVALDAGMLAACQAVEHYEIARYGSLREWAKVIGNEEAHVLLSEILDQEKAANSKLTNLAVTAINK